MKFAIILFALLFFLPLNAEAKITHLYDDFTEENSYISTNTFGAHRKVSFVKKFENGIPTYKLVIYATVLGGYTELVPIEIKIDKNKVESISLTDAVIFPRFIAGIDNLRENRAIVPIDIVNQIKSSERVAFRLYKGKAYSTVIVLTEANLAEWKEVIAMEK